MTGTKRIVLASISMIVAAGLLVLNPSMIQNTQAQTYANEYGYDSSYGNYYAEPKSSNVEIQKISCINDNKNINGIDITEIPQDNTAVAAANQERADGANTQNGNGFADKINFNKNLVNICVNVNVNEQIRVTEPAEPETTSLTVNKEVFGCNNFETGDAGETRMRCELQDDSSSWLPCADPDVFTNDPTVPIFCQRLTENLNLFYIRSIR